MKSLYESLLTGKVTKPSAKVVPNSRKELEQLIVEHISESWPHPGQEVNFNWIDISLVDDLHKLFQYSHYIPVIDKWNIDHVKDFSDMFNGNKHIKRSPIPILPEKAVKCARMFSGCTSLEEPPVLPAKSLVYESYMGMFAYCENLKHAPKLPATKLAECCYWGMFYGCEKLKAAPTLPAKKLEPYCYKCMFDGCSSLVEPPELPAKEKVEDCYLYMFRNCRSLKKTPEPPFLIDRGMFDGCSSLKKTTAK